MYGGYFIKQKPRSVFASAFSCVSHPTVFGYGSKNGIEDSIPVMRLATFETIFEWHRFAQEIPRRNNNPGRTNELTPKTSIPLANNSRPCWNAWDDKKNSGPETLIPARVSTIRRLLNWIIQSLNYVYQ